MKECVRCELLSECRSINWTLPEGDTAAPVILRRPIEPDGEAGAGDAAHAVEGDQAGQRN
jgi:hypothetical protein